MTELEFFRTCREAIAKASKGIRLCSEIRSELNEDYRNGRISFEEWKVRTDENESRFNLFSDQLDMVSDNIEWGRKHWPTH